MAEYSNSPRHTPTVQLHFLYCSETSAFTFFASIAFFAASASAFELETILEMM